VSPAPVKVGISTCPNDTFAFHALMEGIVEVPGLEFEFHLADVQELNEAATAGTFDVVKISYAAAIELGDRFSMLPVGSALGFGVGPVVIARSGWGQDAIGDRTRILCPGRQTTATLLWELFHPRAPEPSQRPFFEILPALERREADLGVCIHEGRFTYMDHGLELLEDLGRTWEEATRAPLPLGGIAVQDGKMSEHAAAIGRGLRDSIEWAHAHPEAALLSMRKHAQEHSDEVLWKHVELYVNDWTIDLGVDGRRAIEELASRAASSENRARASMLTVLEI
jgi:1,4-dihydroxy-6-naphthoate synthase